ncbi:MAG: 2-C-methyl-D-erythritol 2,4-cyclodiphosphate synthase [Planctomycetota bacterium]|jgi:2-C-methyl-D-erythritol 2,4-cyclodiphosphate synthase
MMVGAGFDIHRLEAGRRLVLGGVPIDHPKGLVGHSDGDVLLHALIDAMLGAAGEGDIGTWFPDTDPKWKDADSADLVAQVVGKLSASWEIVHTDSTVLAEEPKIGPHREKIRARMAELLGVDVSHVSIKAKTMEGLGSIGAKDAIAAISIVQLERKRT